MPGFVTQLILCLALGAFSSLAMAPWGVFPALMIGLSVLYIFTANAGRPLRAFALGGLFGFGYFVCGLSWVGNALLVEGNPYAWAWPLAVCGLPLILAFFPAFACLLARRFADLKTIPGFLAFAAIAVFFEWARGHVFTGFPWNLYGDAWTKVFPLLQILSFSDIYWLTWLSILWFTVPGFLFISDSNPKNKKLLALTLTTLFVFCLSFGFWRLQQPTPPARNGIYVHLVQGNVPQSEKWDHEKVWGHFLKHIELSKPDPVSSNGVTYIIWAETALSQWVLDDPKAMEMIKQTLSLYKGPAYLLTGLLRYEPEVDRFYNSIVMIDKDGKVSNIYDKNHLVPFGEYIPFQNWIPLKPVAEFKGFSGGKGPQTFTTPEGVKYSPVVCYEIIFSGEVANRGAPPDFILNVTNDSWYGDSAGPRQHLYQAVFRAIEEGIPVIRVADTGISAVIDSTGHIIEKSGLFSEYEKTLALPGRSVFSKGDGLINEGLLLVLIICFASVGISKKRKN